LLRHLARPVLQRGHLLKGVQHQHDAPPVRHLLQVGEKIGGQFLRRVEQQVNIGFGEKAAQPVHQRLGAHPAQLAQQRTDAWDRAGGRFNNGRCRALCQFACDFRRFVLHFCLNGAVLLERLVEFGQSDAVGFQVVCPAGQHIQRRFLLIARRQCDGNADALAVQAEHPQQRRLAHAADAVDDQHPFGQRRRRQPLPEHFAQMFNIGEIVLEFAVKIVLHRVCRSHVFFNWGRAGR
jgi:hypothetical protein